MGIELKALWDPHSLGCISFIVSDRLGTEHPIKTEEIKRRLIHLGDWTFPQSFSRKIKVLRNNPGLTTERFAVPELGLFDVSFLEALQAIREEFVAKGELIAAS